MTTETKQGEGQATQGERQETVDVKEIQAQLARLESSNARLLSESQDYKKKSSEYKAQLDEAAKQAISGDTAKQLDYERKERERLEQDNKALKTNNLKREVRSAVMEFAKDVHDIDDLMNQPTFSHILANGVDQEKGTVDKNAAKDFVNKVLEAKPWLKKNVQQAGVDTSKPNTNSAKTIGDVKKGDHKDIIKSALANW